MSTASEPEMIARMTRTCQIIVGSLVAGVVIFLGIAASIDLGIKRPAPPAAGDGQPAERPNKMPEANPGADAGANANRDAGTLLDAIVSGSFLTYAAILFAAIALPLSLVLPGIVAAQQRRAVAAGKWPVPPQHGIASQAPATETGQLAMVYQAQLIIGAAMIEGAAFFAAIAYFIEKSPLALGLAAVLIMAIVLRFPTQRRVELWIDQQREKLMLEKQTGV